jgi:hypothetical protein
MREVCHALLEADNVSALTRDVCIDQRNIASYKAGCCTPAVPSCRKLCLTKSEYKSTHFIHVTMTEIFSRRPTFFLVGYVFIQLLLYNDTFCRSDDDIWQTGGITAYFLVLSRDISGPKSEYDSPCLEKNPRPPECKVGVLQFPQRNKACKLYYICTKTNCECGCC